MYELSFDDRLANLKLPESIKREKRFLFSRLRTPKDKKPCYVDADGNVQQEKWNRPENWHTYDEAVEHARRVGGFIGIAIHKESDLCCLDLDGLEDSSTDDIVSEGRTAINAALAAAGFILDGKCYCERSLSGRGRHYFFRASDMPAEWTVSLDPKHHRGLEFYSRNRYVLLGQTLEALEAPTLPAEAGQVLDLIDSLRKAAGDEKTWAAAKERPKRYPLEDATLDQIRADIDAELARLGLEVIDEVSAMRDGEYHLWKLSECPNCGESDRPGIFLLDDGEVRYKCFREGRCSTFKIDEFLAKFEIDPMPPWKCNGFAATDPHEEAAAAIETEEESRIAATLEAFGVVDVVDLWRADLRVEYYIEDLLIKDQPMIIGGASKSLKTSIAIDAVTALVLGPERSKQFAGKDVLTDGLRVLLVSGESGFAVIRDTIRRVLQEPPFPGSQRLPARARSMGVSNISSGTAMHPGGGLVPGSVEAMAGRFWLSERVPDLSSKEGRNDLDLLLKATQPDIVFFDPAYLMFAGDDAGNMFAVGRELRLLTNICRKHGVTPVILHHFGKAVKPKGANTDVALEDLAWSGWNQFAGQWWLLGRANDFDGRQHCLRFKAGNRNGDFADLMATVIERYPGEDYRVWDAEWVAWGEGSAKLTQVEQEAKAAEEESDADAAWLAIDEWFPKPKCPKLELHGKSEPVISAACLARFLQKGDWLAPIPLKDLGKTPRERAAKILAKLTTGDDPKLREIDVKQAGGLLIGMGKNTRKVYERLHPVEGATPTSAEV